MNHLTPPPYDPQSGYGYPQQPVAGGPHPTMPRPLHKMKRIYAGGLFLLLIGTGCGAATGDEGARTAGDSKAQPGPTVTTTATVTATAAVTPTSAASSPTAGSKTPDAAAVETAALPDFVGMNHQDAQDTAQAAGFFDLREEDASGMERFLVLDRNWKVCKQEPAPGEHAVGKTITLYAVKAAESC